MAVWAAQRVTPSVLYYVNSQARKIALTIDDSPTPHTGELLDTLKEYKASATFFIIASQAQRNLCFQVLFRT
jgi:peptidoglycan/xylan/chitin deacetylase (PgdA/CDA1 family)